jgi:hypothetical protein
MRAIPAILAGLATLGAAPAAAGAAALEPLNACYRSVDRTTRESVAVKASGFTPGADVSVAIDGVVVATDIKANELGDVSGSVTAPYQGRGERAFTLSVTESERPASTASAQSHVAALNARLKPRRATPSSHLRFLGRGFLDDTEIFGHYVRAGKLRRTVSLGTPGGSCGRLDVARRQIPVRHPATGRWTLQIDNQREYSPRPATVFVRLSITVKRVIGSP